MIEESSAVIRPGCFGITIRLDRAPTAGQPAGGTIQSDLREPGQDKPTCEYNSAVDGLEALVLAHACAGIDVSAPAYVEGVKTAAECIANILS